MFSYLKYCAVVFLYYLLCQVKCCWPPSGQHVRLKLDLLAALGFEERKETLRFSLLLWLHRQFAMRRTWVCPSAFALSFPETSGCQKWRPFFYSSDLLARLSFNRLSLVSRASMPPRMLPSCILWSSHTRYRDELIGLAPSKCSSLKCRFSPSWIARERWSKFNVSFWRHRNLNFSPKALPEKHILSALWSHYLSYW